MKTTLFQKALGLIVALSVLSLLAPAADAGTIDDVRARGVLKCGVNPNTPGFAATDAKGVYGGFDVDYCRAVAAAIGVGVKIFPLTGRERFPALQSGEVDMLSRRTTWTMSRDAKLGFDFAAVTFYDGQGFMIPKKAGIKSAMKLGGATVCVQAGTTTELNLADFFRSNNMKHKGLTFETKDQARLAYEAGRCDAMTGDASSLAALRTIMKKPSAHAILPEIISKEPLAPLTRHGDNQFNDLVRWVINVTIIAEEKGITQANVERTAATSNDPETQRMLGKTGSFGAMVGVSPDFAVKVLKKVGNYGEIFERNIGVNTPLALERGYNQLWSKGGILYSPPVR